MATKILVVEDDNRLAELIKRSLEEEDFLVDLAFDGEMAFKLSNNQDYDLIISDIILPKMNGLDLCKMIRKVNPNIPVIMLTALGTTNDKVEGFDSGADDYLVKPFEFRELQVRIRALLKRAGQSTHSGTSVLSYHDLSLNLHSKRVHRQDQEIHLSPKEFKLLEFFLQHPERILNRTEIAEAVWNTHYDTGTNFIDVYITYLRKKVDKPFGTKLIHTKSGMGFILKK